MAKPTTAPTENILSEADAYKLYKQEDFLNYFKQTADLQKGAERTEHGEMAWDKTLSLSEAYQVLTPLQVQMLTGLTSSSRMFGSKKISSEQPEQAEAAKKKL